MCEEIQICVLESLINNILNSECESPSAPVIFLFVLCSVYHCWKFCLFGEVGASSQHHGTKNICFLFPGNLLKLETHPVQTSLIIKWEFFVDWQHLRKKLDFRRELKSGWGWKKRLGEKCVWLTQSSEASNPSKPRFVGVSRTGFGKKKWSSSDAKWL